MRRMRPMSIRTMGRAIFGGLLTLAILGAGCARAAEPAQPRAAQADQAARQTLEALLSDIRARHDLPALAAAVILDGRLLTYGAVGVRKAGQATPVTRDDAFHLGSCTKAMTATLVEMLVEQGKLKWTVTLAEVFPDMASAMQPAYRGVTLRQVLAHRAGLPGADRSWPEGKTFLDLHRLPGPAPRQREAYVRLIL
ncbi:MAG: beta-lactamase family protein, partial [Planctomycetes bacterium]|nr:beta-lactamase family protein [Planctomycetota bacterium]